MNRKKVSNSSKNTHKNISKKNKKIIFKDSSKHITKSSKNNILKISGAELLEIKTELPRLDNTSTNNNLEAQNNNSTKKNEEDSEWMKILAIGILIIIILFWITIIAFSISISTGQKMAEKNVTLITYSPIKVSFQTYNSIMDKTDSQNITILGYLRKEITTINEVETISRYILDDYNKTIKIITDKNEELFTTNSRYTYNVSGLYYYSNGEYILEPYIITKQSRILVEQKEQRVENVTVGRKAGVYINLSDGWRKIFTLISNSKSSN